MSSPSVPPESTRTSEMGWPSMAQVFQIAHPSGRASTPRRVQISM
ncbi:hypothetical protein ACWDR9_01040 [Streptosporangium sandarakinum]